MTISDDKNNLFNTPIANDSLDNNRMATRYIREDIKASVYVKTFLGFGKTVNVELLDITSKGVLVTTDEKLSMNKKINLTLKFDTGKTFDIKAKIVRHAASAKNEYGIQFDAYNNELGDYLLETQDKLIFK